MVVKLFWRVRDIGCIILYNRKKWRFSATPFAKSTVVEYTISVNITDPPQKKIQPAKIHLYFKHTFFSVLFHEGLLPQCIVSQIKYQVSFRFYKMIEVMLLSALPQVKEMYQRVGKILLNYEHISFRANTFSLLIHGLCWAWEITPKTKVRWLL